MGKIFNALDKYRKERKISGLPQKLKPSDWRVLQRYDRATGKLDINDPNIRAEALERLQFYRLVKNDGSLTPAGLAKCVELSKPTESTMHQEPSATCRTDAIKEKLEPVDKPPAFDIESAIFESRTAEADFETMELDWDPSLKHDRETRHFRENDGAANQLYGSHVDTINDSDYSLESRTESRQVEQHSLEDVPSSYEPELKKISLVKPPQAKVHVIKESTPKSGEQDEEFVSVYDAPVSPGEVEPSIATPSGDASAVYYDVKAIDKKLVALSKPQSFEAEQFKILRTNLLYPTSGRVPRSVIVTSALPNEGKSFVSANLAVSVASDIDRHVLLIDCDLRSPSLHSTFGFKDVPGLSDYLAKGVPLASLLLRTNVDKLTILPAGLPPSNPAELLSSEKMSTMLQEVCERYGDRMIIIDTPPPHLTAETKALASKVDGIVLVIKFGSTPRDSVTELIARLGEKKIIGSIINNFDLRSSGYYGKNYGKYYEK